MMRICAWLVLAAIVWPADASAEDCRDAPAETDFAQCWHEQYLKSEESVQQKLRTLMERHRRDEPELAALLATSQDAWFNWRTAACHVQTYDSRKGTAFGVYWDMCLARMNRARDAELQFMLDNP